MNSNNGQHSTKVYKTLDIFKEYLHLNDLEKFVKFDASGLKFSFRDNLLEIEDNKLIESLPKKVMQIILIYDGSLVTLREFLKVDNSIDLLLASAKLSTGLIQIKDDYLYYDA